MRVFTNVGVLIRLVIQQFAHVTIMGSCIDAYMLVNSRTPFGSHYRVMLWEPQILGINGVCLVLSEPAYRLYLHAFMQFKHE